MIIGVCAAIIADVMDHTIRDPEQAARSLDTSVLGTLPTVKGHASAHQWRNGPASRH